MFNNKYFIIPPEVQKWMFPAVNITSSIFCIYWIVTNFNFSSLIILYLTSLILGGWVISMFPHRAWSHKSWQPNKFVEFVGLFLFTLLMTGSSIGFVGTHRQHHRYSDTEDDPHSPYFVSRWRIQFMLWNTKLEPFYIKDIIKKPMHVWFFKYYWFVNLVWLIALYVISTELLMFWLAMIGFTHLKEQSVNTFCHNTPKFFLPIGNSLASNVLLLTITTPGECWHKNHHEDPKNYRFGKKWYEIDPPALVIKLLCLAGLASVYSTQD